MNKLYSVSVYWKDAAPTEPMASYLETAITFADDWIRFSGHQWFVYSARSTVEISAAFSERLVRYAGSQCIVTALEPTAANGAAPDWIWTWLNEKMAKQLSDKFKSGL